MIPKFLRLPLLFVFFWFLAMLETSFFSFLNVFGWQVHLIWIAVFFINLFEDRYGTLGFWSAVFGGFFLDFLSPLYFFGFNTAVLAAASLAFKFVLLRYVGLPVSQRSKKS